MSSMGVRLLAVVLLWGMAAGQLYSVQYGFGTSDCSGETYSINAVATSATSPCVPSGCTLGAGGRSSYVTCLSAPPVPTSKMTCGYDQFSLSGCVGSLVTRARVALGVCVAHNGASIMYTDCDAGGKPSTFVQYSDTRCAFPTSTGAVVPPVAGRTCLGNTCAAGSVSFLCNAVVPTVPQRTCFASPDLNGDGLVNLLDIVVVLNSWGKCETDYRCFQADQNCDGVLTLLDLSAIISFWSP